jgi:hypothetical protein
MSIILNGLTNRLLIFWGKNGKRRRTLASNLTGKSQKFRCGWMEEVTRTADPNAQKKEIVGERHY